MCQIVGTSCCTYIPANDERGGEIDQALNHLKDLSNAQQGDFVKNSSWWQWLASGGWKAALSSVLSLLAAGFAILLFCSCCGVPIIKRLISRMLNSNPFTN